jgi:hypothetical protein
MILPAPIFPALPQELMFLYCLYQHCFEFSLGQRLDAKLPCFVELAQGFPVLRRILSVAARR